jgi:hypothetical protein
MGRADHVDWVFRGLKPGTNRLVRRSALKSPFPLAGKGLGMGVSAQASPTRPNPKAANWKGRRFSPHP